jgi:hypothetical protein
MVMDTTKTEAPRGIVINCLGLISGAESVVLNATDGSETINNAEGTFTAFLDSDFRGWGCEVKSNPTDRMEVEVYEMFREGDFSRIFRGFNNDLDRLCLTQSQIIQFVKDLSKWLNTDCQATFFLFKVGNEFLVARVYLHSNGHLEAYVHRLSHGLVWGSDKHCRVVVPKH